LSAFKRGGVARGRRRRALVGKRSKTPRGRTFVRPVLRLPALRRAGEFHASV